MSSDRNFVPYNADEIQNFSVPYSLPYYRLIPRNTDNFSLVPYYDTDFFRIVLPICNPDKYTRSTVHFDHYLRGNMVERKRDTCAE